MGTFYACPLADSTMRKLSPLTVVLILAAAGLIGCGGSSALSIQQAQPTPPPPPPSKTLALASSDGTFSIFNLPIANTSAPVATIAESVGVVQGMVFDASGRLFVANSFNVQVFTQPITSGAGPAFVLVVNLHPDSVAFDEAGNLFVGGYIPSCRYCAHP